jgi:Flp pilus assembly protein CpaB
VLVFVQKGTAGIETGTKTILQDIKVFAVNDQVRSSEEKGSESITAKTVTLLVTPSAAEKLALANEIGKIRLVMRGQDDQDTVNPAGTQIETLFGTEKMDRNSEDPNRPTPSSSSPVSSLTALLGSQAPKASPPPEPLPRSTADEQFPMQIIKGTEISEAVFRRKFDDPTHWTNSSQGSDGAGDSTPATTTPPVDTAKKADKSKTPGTKPDDGSPKEDSRQGSPATHS